MVAAADIDLTPFFTKDSKCCRAEFRQQFMSVVSGVSNSPARGMFIDACYAHCQTGTQETWLRADSPVLGNTVRAHSFIIKLSFCNHWFIDLLSLLAVDCKGSWRLVFQQEQLPEDRLCLPLQPHLSQSCFRWQLADRRMKK